VPVDPAGALGLLEDPHAAIPTAQLTNASVIKGRWRGVARLVLTLGMSVEAPSDLQSYANAYNTEVTAAAASRRL
jgi:hypothetical protein